MKPKKRTPPVGSGEAQRCVGVRPSCGPHVHKYSPPRREDKPKLRPRSARSRRARSRYRPGSDYRPPEEALARRQAEVLEVLKKAGPDGVTRLEAPDHLKLSWPQRISELRSKGYGPVSSKNRARRPGKFNREDSEGSKDPICRAQCPALFLRIYQGNATRFCGF